jgi:hypothetical protein
MITTLPLVPPAFFARPRALLNVSGFTRNDFVENKKILTDRSRQLAAKGKKTLYDEIVSRYREV